MRMVYSDKLLLIMGIRIAKLQEWFFQKDLICFTIQEVFTTM